MQPRRMNARGEQTRSLWMKVEVASRRAAISWQAELRHGHHRIRHRRAVGRLRTGRSWAKVIVIDRGPIAGGMTSRTTAHLAPICDDGLSTLINLRGEETARLFQESQEAAVARIEEIVEQLGIDCNFRRLDAFLFPAMGMEPKEARDQRAEEFDAARKVGAAPRASPACRSKGFEKAPGPALSQPGHLPSAAISRGLVAAIRDKGGRIFANSPVIAVEECRRRRARCDREWRRDRSCARRSSPRIRRSTIALRCTPRCRPIAPMRWPSRLPRGSLPDALFWDMGDPYHYVRLNPGPGSVDYLIAGGADHKSGEADDGDIRFEAIEAWITALVPSSARRCALVRAGPGHDRLLRLHRPQSRQQSSLCRAPAIPARA